jgi:hypothetical protein
VGFSEVLSLAGEQAISAENRQSEEISFIVFLV